MVAGCGTARGGGRPHGLTVVEDRVLEHGLLVIVVGVVVLVALGRTRLAQEVAGSYRGRWGWLLLGSTGRRRGA